MSFCKHKLAIGTLLVLFSAPASSVLANRCDSLTASMGACSMTVVTGSVQPHVAGTDRYVTPAMPTGSLFDQRQYGRLADGTNIYPEPTGSVAPLRNAGDGYIFASVNRWFKNEVGETWYEINHGEFVHEDDITLVAQSGFQGVEITRQPERPFGWVVQNVVPSSRTDGAPDESMAELERYQFVEVYDTRLGEDGWLWYDVGNGRWAKQTQFSIVDVNPRPEGIGDQEFWTEVDLYEQTVAAYEGDQMVYASLISSGLNRWPTREGLFQVWERWNEYKMSGAEGQTDYYFLEDIPYIMYFDKFNGIALHGTYWHDRFGFKHSHGCVNMPIKDAEWVFRWSNNAPNDLWVWVHTSNPIVHLQDN